MGKPQRAQRLFHFRPIGLSTASVKDGKDTIACEAPLGELEGQNHG